MKNPDKFPRWRAVELKHGRIAMAASTGYIVQEFLRWPGYLSPTAGVKFSELPNGIAAWHQIPMGGIAQFMLFMALMEASWQYYDIPSRKVGGGKDMFDFVVPAGKSPGGVAGDFWVRFDDPVKAEKEHRAQQLAALRCWGDGHADARPPPRHVGAAGLSVTPRRAPPSERGAPECREIGSPTWAAALPASYS